MSNAILQILSFPPFCFKIPTPTVHLISQLEEISRPIPVRGSDNPERYVSQMISIASEATRLQIKADRVVGLDDLQPS